VKHSEFDYYAVNREKEFNKREGAGKVKLSPKNFVTGPMKKGGGRSTVGVTLEKGFKYSEDPFDRKRDLERKERYLHQKRLLGKERPFTSTKIHPGTFDSTNHVYGEDDVLFK